MKGIGKFKLILLVLIFLISSPSSFTVFQGRMSNEKATQNTKLPEQIFERTSKFFLDKQNQGYFDEINDTGFVTSNSKVLADYITAVNALIDLLRLTGNTTYQNLIPDYLKLIDKFETSNGGYISVKNNDWTTPYNAEISPISLSQLISMYSNLYNLTKDINYLNKALNIYNFNERYSHDFAHGGYYSRIDPTTLKYQYGYRRVTGYYGIIAQSDLDLYRNTNNLTILQNGFQLLNNTINVAYNYPDSYFYEALYDESNQPDHSFTTFKVFEQLDIASALLHYSFEKELPQFNENRTVFYNISMSIVNNILDKLINSNNIMMEEYDVNTKVVDNHTYDTRQAQLYNMLLAMKDYNVSLTEKENTLLNDSSMVFTQFVGKNSGLFMRRPDYQVTSPWINFAIINTIVNLENHSYTVTIQIPNNNTFTASQSMTTTSNTSTTQVKSSSSITTTSLNSVYIILGLVVIFNVKKLSKKGKK